MKELLLTRKSKFIQYLIATFMFVIEHFVQMGVVALIFGAIERRDFQYFKLVGVATVAYVIYTPLNFLISRLLRIRYMRDTILDVRKQAFKKIIDMPFKQYSQKSKEVYISNLINDINTFENKFFVSFLNFLINMVMFFVSLIILLILDFRLAIGMLVFSVLLFLMARLFTKKSTSLEKEISEAGEIFTTDMSNTFNGLEILKLNNIEDKFLKKSVSAVNRLEQRKYMANVFNHLQRDVIYVLAFAVSIVVMIYLSLGIQRNMSLSEATMLFLLATSVSNYLIDVFPMWNQVKASAAIYDKIAKPEENAVKIGRGTKEFKFEDKIEVSHVNFSFENKQVLKDVSFTIEKGKKYLIKGVSGAGKTTLINLLAMVYDDYEGNITVDGIDYRDISEESFHKKVAFIYQDVFLFEDTIKNNIALYQDIPEERLNYAVKVSGLEPFLEERKEGINERLSENGKNLSGGQRQRISIARAIAKDAEILFIDEGTSSLNEELGREIEKTFLELKGTVIAISHRYYEGVTENYDYVIELKNGKVHCFPARDYFEEVITW